MPLLKGASFFGPWGSSKNPVLERDTDLRVIVRLRKAMTPALIGRKLGMTRIYDEKGAVVPVTVVQAGPCAVTQVKTAETDGYFAVQLGFEDCKAKFSTFGEIGHAAKAGVGPKRHFKVSTFCFFALLLMLGLIALPCFRHNRLKAIPICNL